MQHSPKVSVIIPVYNGEKYIAQCIENVLYQTYKEIEIIVIDDGSTDNTAAIAKQYPVQVISQENQGLSASRNRGIEVASGEYIHFMDVDDLLNLEYYAAMIEAITITDADMACGGMVSEMRPYINSLYPDRLLLTTLEDKISTTNILQLGYVWRHLFKKSFLIEKKLLFEVGQLMEDMPFSLQAVFDANRIVTVPNAVYYYKKRAGSIMTTNDRAFKRKRKEDWRKTKAFRNMFMQKHGLNDDVLALQKIEYKFLGIPMFRKIVYNSQRTRWYLFGLYIFQRKSRNV